MTDGVIVTSLSAVASYRRCGHGLSMPDHINPLNAELNPICHLLALLGGATIVVVSRLRVKLKIIM
jgi:hypothetical protein